MPALSPGSFIMRKKLIAAFAIGASAFAMPAGASGDYGGCEPTWSLFNGDMNCASQITIAPGNDTRINLSLLMNDSRKTGLMGAAYPDAGWEMGYAHNFFDWGLFREAAYGPEPEWDDNPYDGSRCVSLKGGDVDFARAVKDQRLLRPQEKDALLEARANLAGICDYFSAGYWVRNDESRVAPQMAWSDVKMGDMGMDYMTYLVGAAAFYAEDWERAEAAFEDLPQSDDAWLREVSEYMQARVLLNAAQAGAFDEWGDFSGTDATDKTAAGEALVSLESYVRRYPNGRYTSSAKGLQRRALWLANDLNALAGRYQALLQDAHAGAYETSTLLDEVDSKLILSEGAQTAISSPLLLATYDLMRMRGQEGYDYGQPPLTLAELESHEATFRDTPDIYSFLRANYAFYVDRDAKAALAFLPEVSFPPRFSALEFSRQMLRGQALAELGDKREEQHWRGMLKGATALYQRPAVELALALNLEKAGRLDAILGKDSPIEDSMIRKTLLHHVAGPESLRLAAADADRPAVERQLALFTLLYKELSRGRYAAYLGDAASIPQDAETEGGLWRMEWAEDIPLGLFENGRMSGPYPCPSLKDTVQTLSTNAKDVKARLCLGDFYRLNGFDDFHQYQMTREEGELGGSKPQFPGEKIPRSAFYSDILADRTASRDDRAYALYRAVRCYAPAGYSSCGGEEVPEEQRKAWFETLKSQYSGTRWARDLEYYW